MDSIKIPDTGGHEGTQNQCFIVLDKSGNELVGCIKELTWLFQLLLKKGDGVYTDGVTTAVKVSTLLAGPFFKDKNTIQTDVCTLVMPVIADKGFLRKYDMTKYQPHYEYNGDSFVQDGSVFFTDFTDDFLIAYMEDRLGIKTGPGINANQKSKVILQKTKKKRLQLPDLPNDLKWEEITIRFLNGGEVQITAKGLVYQVSHELMGFQDEKTKKPNFQWNLLKLLSLKGGYLNWSNNRELDIKTRDRVKKQKQGLSERLKVYFHSVEGDPFFNYRTEDGYKIRIQLIPEQGSDIQDTIEAISNTMDYYDEDNDVNIGDYSKE
ncbi:MAG: hypothetical protein WDK96_01490 [Candidatus Paceibacterota bacterium]|jgi:hypothetical protein